MVSNKNHIVLIKLIILLILLGLNCYLGKSNLYLN